MDSSYSTWNVKNKLIRSLVGALIFFVAGTLSAIPDVSLQINRFRAASSPFVEVSLYIVGSSLRCWPGKSDEYGVEYTLVVKDAASNILSGNKYRLSNKNCPARDLIDIRRFNLGPGTYSVE